MGRAPPLRSLVGAWLAAPASLTRQPGLLVERSNCGCHVLDLVGLERVVDRDAQDMLGLLLGDGEVASLVAKLGPDRLEMQRQRVVDSRPDAMLRQVRLEGVA